MNLLIFNLLLIVFNILFLNNGFYCENSEKLDSNSSLESDEEFGNYLIVLIVLRLSENKFKLILICFDF